MILGLVVAVSGFQPMAAQASGNHFTVDSTIDAPDATPGDGSCAVSSGLGSVCTLRAAVDETNALSGPDTIDLPAGVYVLASVFRGVESDAGDVDIVASDVKICGAGAETTIIDGNDQDRVFEISDGSDVTLCGVTIRNGMVDAFPGGGGILNRGSRVKLMGVTVRDNEAHAGGGITNFEIDPDDPELAAVLTLDRSIIAGNKGKLGGGIFNFDGVATLELSAVTGNSAGSGGGITSFTSGAAAEDPTEVSLRVRRSTVSGNSAESVPDVSSGSAGALANHGGAASIESSTISNNTASGTGAISNGGSVTITNSTISGNTATTACFDGLILYAPDPGTVVPACGTGGIKNFGSLLIYSTTVTKNTAPSGAGLTAFLGSAAIGNTIISANSPANCDLGDSHPMTSLGHNLEATNTCHLTHPTDLVDTDPNLGVLASNGGPTKTHALLSSSAAINAATGCPAKDQRGVARPATCDIGAYERGPFGDLAVDKTVDCDSVRMNGMVAFRITADNFGTDRAANVVVTDSLPPSLGFVSVEASDGTCSIVERRDGGVDVVCSVPSLAPDGTFTLVVTVQGLSPGNAENLALISSSSEDSDRTNNVARASVTVFDDGR